MGYRGAGTKEVCIMCWLSSESHRSLGLVLCLHVRHVHVYSGGSLRALIA